MKKIDISVCVPAYNRPHALSQLLASFLCQDYSHAELLVVDDSPNNNNKIVVDSYMKKIKELGTLKIKETLVLVRIY